MTTCASFPDDRLIVSAGRDCTLRLWQAGIGRPALRGSEVSINTYTFSPDEKLILSSSADWNVRLWNPASGKSVRVFEDHLGAMQAGAFSRDGRLIFSAGQD